MKTTTTSHHRREARREAFTPEERRYFHEQALASSRLEGFVPGPQYLADCEAVIAGTMTRDQARAASLARALARDKAAREEIERIA
ncbi:hypothetical protein AGMMS50225_04030 [Betaproteobacteria bacterium]|nr:hypothetical protein AGMMS50225_04030 [Betaproteobacteria bacterium]